MVWNVTIGWLITPVINYGWEINTSARLRTMTAYEDLETRKAIANLRAGGSVALVAIECPQVLDQQGGFLGRREVAA